MGTSLKYNLSEYAKANSDIKNLKSDIQKSKKKMEDGLNQIKKDWTTDGGKAFFDSIDTDWETAVQNCLDILDDLTDALDSAYEAYDDIEDDAKTYLKMVCNTIYKKVDEDDNAGKEKAYKSFHNERRAYDKDNYPKGEEKGRSR